MSAWRKPTSHLSHLLSTVRGIRTELGHAWADFRSGHASDYSQRAEVPDPGAPDRPVAAEPTGLALGCGEIPVSKRRPLVRHGLILAWIGRRLGWGVADQAMSSVTNFAVNIYVARSVGAVAYGAFSLAYLTYSFALNASRGLATDPLLVRFSGAPLPEWRRAVRNCTGTSALVGVAAAAFVLVAAALMHGTARMAFLALGLTLPGLLLQDSWRFAFFASRRGGQAFVNDAIWAALLLPAIFVLRRTGQADVFWLVLAWGASATLGAAVGPLQARVVPSPSGAPGWLHRHRDLGPRYLVEGTCSSAQTQLRGYGLGLILGLAAVGYVQAAATLMGPFMVVFFGMGLVILPEAVGILQRSPQHLRTYCAIVSAALAVAALLWGVILLIALPRGLGRWLLGGLWIPTYPLVLPFTISVMGGCVISGAGTGLHALGAARRSLRSMLMSGALYVACGLVGAVAGGAEGTVWGAALATWTGAILYWWQLRDGLRDFQAAGAPDPALAGSAPADEPGEALDPAPREPAISEPATSERSPDWGVT